MPPEKRSIVKTLVERAEEIPTTSVRIDREKTHVLEVLEDNNCPSRFMARKSCDSFRRASGLSDYLGMSDELIN